MATDHGGRLLRQLIGKKIGAGRARPLRGNSADILEAGRHRDIMSSVRRILSWFRCLKLQGYQVGRDEGCGLAPGRMDEEGFHLKRINTGRLLSETPRAPGRAGGLGAAAWIVTLPPIVPGPPAPALWTVTGYVIFEVSLFFARDGADRPAGRANWDRFRSIASAQYARKESLGGDTP